MEKLLVELADGGIVNIEQDNWSTPGCETCDYGSSYVNELVVYLTKYKITTEVNQMYEYLLSDGDLFKIFLRNIEEIKTMTEMEFINWFELQIKSYTDDNEAGVEYKYSNIKMEGEML